MDRVPRIALAHDWLCGYRGGEAVLEAIARVVRARFRTAGLYTMFDDGRPLAPAVDALPRIASPLNRLPGGPGRLRRWLLPLYPRAVGWLTDRLDEHHRQEPIDLLISTSSAAIKGLRPPPGVPHLCYCHSPARYLWSQRAEYGGDDPAGRLRGLGLRLCGRSLRRWDRRTAANVTHFLANSGHTAREVRRCYGREAGVVFPPVRTEFFTPAPADDSPPARTNAWLVAGALEPYKRVDLAISAANSARHSLMIAGDGSQRARLERSAGPTVTFRGRVSDDELRDLYRTSRLLLFPQVEDFGIAAAEAQACGLPVVARGAGGALDIVQPGSTGALFEEPTPQALLDAIARAPDPATSARACAQNARRFSEVRFDAQIVAQIERMLRAPA